MKSVLSFIWRFIEKYNLIFMTVILMVFDVLTILSWKSSTCGQKIIAGFMLIYILNEWEEIVFPGGFYDLFFTHFGIETEKADDALHLPVTVTLMIMLIVSWFFSKGSVFLLIPICFSLLDGVIHVAGIKILGTPHPYTPGMVTSLIAFVYAIISIITLNGTYGYLAAEWLLAVLSFIVIFVIMLRFVIGIAGYSYMDLASIIWENTLSKRSDATENKTIRSARPAGKSAAKSDKSASKKDRKNGKKSKKSKSSDKSDGKTGKTGKSNDNPDNLNPDSIDDPKYGYSEDSYPGYPDDSYPGYPDDSYPGYPDDSNTGYPDDSYPDDSNTGYSGDSRYGYSGDSRYGYSDNSRYGYSGNSRYGYSGNSRYGHSGNSRYGYSDNSNLDYPDDAVDMSSRGEDDSFL